MKKISPFILKVFGILIILIAIVFALLVRFTNGELSDGDTVVFGYDEQNSQFQFNEKRTYSFNGTDGPYIIGSTVFNVDESNELQTSALQTDSLLVTVNNKENDHFYVHLKEAHISDTSAYELPHRLVVLSDIEGNFNAISSFLQANKVIDRDHHWIFGKDHLLLLGDFVDRGSEVTQVLWLIYQLEQEAKAVGGQVHFILGNHEIMNIQGNIKYVKPKYRALATGIVEALEVGNERTVLFSQSSELGRWMRSKNSIEKIGPYLFVHAGLHLDIVGHDLSLNDINTSIRTNINERLYKEPGPDEAANFLLGRKGPLWYRGMVIDYKYYDKASSDEVMAVLEHYRAEKVVIGHTVVDDISTDYEGRLIRVDVKHGKEKASGATKGLLIENGKEYAIDDLGVKSTL